MKRQACARCGAKRDPKNLAANGKCIRGDCRHAAREEEYKQIQRDREAQQAAWDDRVKGVKSLVLATELSDKHMRAIRAVLRANDKGISGDEPTIDEITVIEGMASEALDATSLIRLKEDYENLVASMLEIKKLVEESGLLQVLKASDLKHVAWRLEDILREAPCD